jgi:DHA1 family bicyclomycin/chloramphenicol resistance-like MFS transporter
MPIAAHDLNATAGLIQLAITVYLVGMAIGQIGSGTLSDSLGRKPVLLGGLLLFTAGSLLCGIAPSIMALLWGRGLQAIGGATILVAARAMIVDLAKGRDATHDLAALATILLISPAIAPALGGILVMMAGWRAMFFVLVALGLVLVMVTGLRLHETRVACPAQTRMQAPFAAWRGLLGNGYFLRLALGNAMLSVSLYMFLTAAPFVLGRVGMTPRETGFSLLPVAGGAILGTRSLALVANLTVAPMRVGVAIVLTSLGLLWLGAALGHGHEIMALIGPISLFAYGIGILGPITMASALSVDRDAVGSASSLFGALQLAICAGGTAFVAAAGVTTSLGVVKLLSVSMLTAALVLPRARLIHEAPVLAQSPELSPP